MKGSVLLKERKREEGEDDKQTTEKKLKKQMNIRHLSEYLSIDLNKYFFVVGTVRNYCKSLQQVFAIM